MYKETLVSKIADSTPKRLIYALSVQYLLARAVHVATELNLGEILTEVPQSFDAIKSKVIAVNDAYFLRLLKFLAHHTIIAMNDRNEFSASSMTRFLSIRNSTLMISEKDWCAQGNLIEYLNATPSCLEDLCSKKIQIHIHDLPLS